VLGLKNLETLLAVASERKLAAGARDSFCHEIKDFWIIVDDENLLVWFHLSSSRERQCRADAKFVDKQNCPNIKGF